MQKVIMVQTVTDAISRHIEYSNCMDIQHSTKPLEQGATEQLKGPKLFHNTSLRYAQLCCVCSRSKMYQTSNET